MRRLCALARRHRWWVWALWALGLLVLLGGPTGALDPLFWLLAPDPELLALTVVVGLAIVRSSFFSYARALARSRHFADRWTGRRVR
jgi:hypothetical protein